MRAIDAPLNALWKDILAMFGAGKSAQDRREETMLADRAAEYALDALLGGAAARARAELDNAPRRVPFGVMGWKLELARALVDFADGRIRAGNMRLVDFVRRLDETSFSRDDRGYLSLFALYRSIEASRKGRAPAALREAVEDFRFDHTLVSRDLRRRFPLRREAASAQASAPPYSVPPSGGDPF